MEPGVRKRARQVLEDALLWNLTAEQWIEVRHALRKLQGAREAGDERRLRDAVADLEVAGPHRISGLEDAGRLPAPRQLRERINELIHALDPPGPSAQLPLARSRQAGQVPVQDSDAGA
jgi:CATRA-associated small protein